MAKKTIIDLIGFFIEKVLPFLFLIYIFIIAFNNYFEFNSNIEKNLQQFFENVISDNLGTFTTVAAVFIGFYLTSLSILGTVKVRSVIIILENNKINKYLTSACLALISAFVFLFYSMFLFAIDNTLIKVHLFNILFLFMVLSSVSYSLIIINMFLYDINNLKKEIEEKEQEKIEIQETFRKLDKYLDRKEEEQQKIINEQVRQTLEYYKKIKK